MTSEVTATLTDAPRLTYIARYEATYLSDRYKDKLDALVSRI